MEYDALELCSPELQDKLKPMRDKFEDVRMKKIELELVSPPTKSRSNYLLSL